MNDDDIKALPPLPDLDAEVFRDTGAMLAPDVSLCVRRQMRAYARAAVNAERERCAMLCEAEARMHEHVEVTGRGRHADYADICRTCAATIRARND